MDLDSDVSILSGTQILPDGSAILVLPDGHTLKTSAEGLSSLQGKMEWASAVREVWGARQADAAALAKRAKLDGPPAPVEQPKRVADPEDPTAHARAQLDKYDEICNNLTNEIELATAELQKNLAFKSKWKKIVETLEEGE